MKGKPLLKVLLPCWLAVFFAGQAAGATGQFEFNAHYGKWSLNLLKSLIENSLNDVLESDIKKRFLEKIQEDHPSLTEKSYSQEVNFDSGGDNYGFELRWYPGGEKGSFSLGLGVEKTSMKISFPKISGSLDLQDTSAPVPGQAGFKAEASSEFRINPLSLHLSFRWDILPSSKVHPYLTLGVGAATGTSLDQATVMYSYTGDLTIPGQASQHYEDSINKTLKEIKDEMEADGEDFPFPPFVPFFQLNLGLKGMITNNLHLMIDAGIWDGFLLRGGLSLRF